MGFTWRIWLAALLCWPALALADARVHSYALVIGSNRGGDGQAELAFAQRDADNVAAVLRELGRTKDIVRLNDPTPAQVASALTDLQVQLGAHAAAGERAQLLFYYSGHARAKSLSLGDQELSLASLRASLLALPSTLTVVVLDACQSGAFSGVKGARPAADFSVQSVQNLESSGIAVMASSTGSEFSQESRELGSSYFTHHLLASLRGAGDRDRNGRVSLDEAYAYAYQNTLADTARTQVGSQHATLETALTGRGDVPLSYPVDADAQLAFGGDVSGKILVQQSGHGAVMAELVKAEGVPMMIALPSGRYEVLVREKQSARSCDVTLTRGAVASVVPQQCEEVRLPVQTAKAAWLTQRETWFLELGISLLRPLDDGYTRRLTDFGYGDSQVVDITGDMAFGWMLSPKLGVLLRYGVIDRQNFYGPAPKEMIWTTQAITIGARGVWPLLGRRLQLFGDASVGAAFARSRFNYASVTGSSFDTKRDESVSGAFALRALLGLQLGVSKHFGIYGAAGYAWANTLENELDEQRTGGTFTFLFGARFNGVAGGL